MPAVLTDMPKMADLLHFHVRVYARPAAAITEEPRRIGNLHVTPLRAAQPDLLSAWPITFDEAAARLSRLPRLFLEPDGSFVWVSRDDLHWQIDGLLSDMGPRLAYVELRGTCQQAAFDDLLRCFGWPQTPLALEMIAEGMLLDEADFRKLATACASG